MNAENQKVIEFTPENWSSLMRFLIFWQTTYHLSNHDLEALRGVANNFDKAVRLERVSRFISPRLQEDRDELEAHGHSPSERSKEYTAVVEALITALYSSVDCTRKVLRAIYPKAQGLPDSTRKLFANAVNGKLDQTLPTTIRQALTEASWFTELRVLRDALTHSNTGNCHLDGKTRKISYFHDTFRGFRDPSFIDDFPAYVNGQLLAVSDFLVAIFEALNSTLKDEEHWAICGWFKGRYYNRFVRPSEAVDFNGGRCDAFTWFELKENPTCPWMDECGAYKNRRVHVE